MAGVDDIELCLDGSPFSGEAFILSTIWNAGYWKRTAKTLSGNFPQPAELPHRKWYPGDSLHPVTVKCRNRRGAQETQLPCLLMKPNGPPPKFSGRLVKVSVARVWHIPFSCVILLTLLSYKWGSQLLPSGLLHVRGCIRASLPVAQGSQG